MLRFQGALGLLGFARDTDKTEGDSGNSSRSNSIDDDDVNPKTVYTTTGILIPESQPINEIQVQRFTKKQLIARINEYKSKTAGLRHLCRIYDSKDLVTKQDI